MTNMYPSLMLSQVWYEVIRFTCLNRGHFMAVRMMLKARVLYDITRA